MYDDSDNDSYDGLELALCLVFLACLAPFWVPVWIFFGTCSVVKQAARAVQTGAAWLVWRVTK